MAYPTPLEQAGSSCHDGGRLPCASLARLRRWRRLRFVCAWAAVALASPAVPARDTAPASVPGVWRDWSADGFQHVSNTDDLPKEVANAVVEDGAGFIWVGTMRGLARWDGYQFRVHAFDPGIPGSLPDNLVQLLHRDAAGRLWVGTSGAGLARYDPASERFVAVGAGPTNGLSHVNVRAVTDDGAGGLWVGTDGGLDHLDAAGHVRPVPTGPASASGLRGGSVAALLRDRQDRLWAGTSLGLFVREAGSAHFRPLPLPLPPGAAPSGQQPQPESLLEDASGRLWVGTNAHGAFVVESDGSSARAVLETAGTRKWRKALTASRVMTMVEARPGEVWLGTMGEGIVAVDVASGRTRRMSYHPLALASLPDDTVHGLYRDRQGLVWAATHRGLSRVDPRQAAVLTLDRMRLQPGTDGQARLNYNALLMHRDGRLWLGTHAEGVEVVDPQTGRVQALRPDSTRPETALPADVILSLVQADDGSVFISNYRGLYRASADGRQLARLHLSGRNASAGVGPMLRDGGRLWVGGLIDGLWSLDIASGQSRAVLADPTRQLTDKRITALTMGAGGELWIGTRNGLNRLQPDTGALQQVHADAASAGALAVGFVTSLMCDRHGRLWVGTYGGGVHVMEMGPAGTALRFRRLTSRNGLPDDNVNALIEDDAGQVWTSTDTGLAKIDGSTLQVRALHRADGAILQSYWTNAVARSAQGELLFGAAGGVTLVRPALLRAPPQPPRVVVTELRVGGKLLPADPGARALQVPADANNLAVEFAALDYAAPERSRYAHRLLGYERDWVHSDAKHRLVTYTHLPPGEYTLQLRGANRAGLFSEQVLALPVQVLPAWHQTWGFRILAAAALLAALSAVLQLRTRALRARRRELQQLVDERTAELHAASLALEAKSRALEEKSLVLQHASTSDPLTGLHNRRFLTERIDAALLANLRRAQAAPARGGAPVNTDTLFFLIDVDHFKRVNDELGHAAGDAVLVQVALRLQAALRESDDLVRWGGEEFLAVARDTDRERADELAERLRAGVAETPFRLDNGRPLTVTVSVGHAAWPFLPGHPHALDWLEVVGLADMGLLAAKRLGRNAWVGLQGTAAAQPTGLPARLRDAPGAALRNGEITLSASCATAAAAEALLPHGG